MTNKQIGPGELKKTHTGGYCLGHTLVIGNTRAGKSVLMSLLVSKKKENAVRREAKHGS